MIRVLPRSAGNVLGVELSGKITREDYESILIPNLNRVIAEHGKARLLLDFTNDFSGYEMKALISDLRYGVKHSSQFEKFASINAPAFLNFILPLCDKIMTCRCRSFPKNKRDEAWGWIEG